jgi:hypothetical protein
MFFNERKVMVDLAWKNRLPAIYPEREYAEAGGLIAYGPSVPDNFRRAASGLCRSHSQRGKARRFARRAADQV